MLQSFPLYSRNTFLTLLSLSLSLSLLGCDTSSEGQAPKGESHPEMAKFDFNKTYAGPPKLSPGEGAVPPPPPPPLGRGTDDLQAEPLPTFGGGDFGVEPEVVLSPALAKTCKIKVGDTFPIKEELTDTTDAKIIFGDILGKKATLVLFWDSTSLSSLDALKNLATPGFVANYGDDVAFIAVNVSTTPKDDLKKSGEGIDTKKVKVLFDVKQKLFNCVATEGTARVYVLDAKGEVVWFEPEYNVHTPDSVKATLKDLTSS